MKKILAILLALCMVMAFAACGAKNTDETTAPATTEGTEATVNATFGLEETLPADAEILDEEVAVMTHEEFMAAEGADKVCIETYVQATRSWWNDTICVYAQSPEGGCFMYDMACSKEDAEKLVPGTKIRVTGDKLIFNGLHEIEKSTFEFVENADTYIAETLDATALLGTIELEDHMNEKVSFNGLKVEAANDNGDAFLYNWDGSGSPDSDSDLYFKASVDGKTYTFVIEYYLTGPDSDAYKAVQNLKVGDTIDMEGFLYWYNESQPHITSITKK